MLLVITHMVLPAFLVMLFTMSLTWLMQRALNNAGIVDVTWSYNFLFIVLVFVMMSDGNLTRKLLIAGMVAAWSIRLGTHLLIRVGGHIKEEDGRYKQLRTDWSENLQFKFFMFFQFQGVLNLLLSLPFLLVCLNKDNEITLLEQSGVLKKFKSVPSNKGKVCDVGLWSASRHPNYFFEWLIWVAYCVFALSSPYGWLSVICPALMLHFLYRVTGIPMTEEQAVRTKGDLYRNYQKTTSAFIPWFNKKQLS
jgi:steroid 5-alpha reductase family enzyme